MNEAPSIRILSAGAPKAGVRLCAETYSEKTGRQVALDFATAPVIRQHRHPGRRAA